MSKFQRLTRRSTRPRVARRLDATTNARPSSYKKKNVAPFFFLIQHTSADLYCTECQITTLILVQYTNWFMVNGPKTVIGKTSRHFKKLDAENLHRYSMGHSATFNNEGFFFTL